MTHRREPIRLIVDGEEFDVLADPDQPGAYSYEWVSGPNPGYGFGGRRSDQCAGSWAEHESQIRSFLAQIDPRTGFID